MPGPPKTYDPKDYNVTVNGVPIDPDGIDNFMTFEPASDLVSRTVGSTGESVHNELNDKSGILTIRLLQTSTFNDIFSALAAAGTEFAVSLTDTNGTTVIASPSCRIMRIPNLDLAAEAANNEWLISMLNVIPFIGGKSS